MYAAKRKDTEKYAARLARNGLRAAAYHAGRTPTERELVHQQFLAGGLDVVVATTAFGMGIDKPDVRFVLHADIPESLDSYYQQIGRAGRDGRPAVAVLHYRSEDLGLRRFFATHTPDEAALLAVLTVLRGGGPAARAPGAGRGDRLRRPADHRPAEPAAGDRRRHEQTTTAPGSMWRSTRRRIPRAWWNAPSASPPPASAWTSPASR